MTKIDLNLYEKLIDAAPVGFCMVGLDGRFIRVNPYFCKMVGYTHEELMKMNFADITVSEDLDISVKAREAMAKGEQDTFNFEKRYTHKNGDIVWLHLTSIVVRDDQGRPQYFVSNFQDITQKKLAEAALSSSEQRFRTLFEQAPFSVQLLDLNGKTLQVNAAWKAIAHLPEEFINNYILKEYNILKDPQLEAKGVLPYIRAAYNGQSVVTEPIIYDPAENGGPGRARWLRAFVHPIKNAADEVVEVMLIHHDITDLKEAERKLKESKEAAESANRIKSAFLANMSHEIRTPLGAVLGFAELLKREEIQQQDHDLYLDIISRSGESLMQIINDILDLSRVEAGTIKVEKNHLPIRSIAEDVLNLFQVEAQEKGLKLSLITKSTTPELIYSDEVRLKQILINLVGNAIKFTEKGSIAISIKASVDQLKIEVKDSGPGIPLDDRSWLFQPFSQRDVSSTRKFGGTGLGLALSRRLANIIGGDLTLGESVPGIGSTFVLTLPLTDAAHAAANLGVKPPINLVHDKQEFSSLRGKKILVADDSSDNRLLIERLLSILNVKVDFATNGQESIDKAFSNSFDLILMDIQMPVLDGIGAVSMLRTKGYKGPIVALTAHAMREDEEKSMAAGCNAHISKPCSSENLFRILNDVIRDSVLKN
jgi:PAS domain S-box-containing protein